MASMTLSNNPILLPLIAFVVAFAAAVWLHPYVVRIAQLKGITDNPDKRKLQRAPVPVLGGVVVFFGIVSGLGLTAPYQDCPDMTLFFALMVLMLCIGTMDDILGLTPKLRLLVEIVAALIVIYVGGYQINDFHGLWGLDRISSWIGVPLTILTIVGIINAINLIDGVNGLSSGYCMLACAIFGCYFYQTEDLLMTVLAAGCIGALIPFFVHNVFGNRLRMFIGDGGTLMMGMVLSLFVLRTLDINRTDALPDARFGLIPFTLAVLSIPVFDTLRVMIRRIMRGTSPFHPDKTHLHHAFIGMGFSHFKTTLSILSLNLLIVAGWSGLYRLGCTIDLQLCFVIVCALLFTVGVYLAARNRSIN